MTLPSVYASEGHEPHFVWLLEFNYSPSYQIGLCEMVIMISLKYGLL